MATPERTPKRELNRELIEDLKRLAKLHIKRQTELHIPEDDPARLSHHQWLDKLSAEFGFTYTGLLQHIEALEKASLNTKDAAVWGPRLAAPWRWGTLTEIPGQEPNETMILPVSRDTVPWPNCFARSNLFTAADGSERRLPPAAKNQ